MAVKEDEVERSPDYPPDMSATQKPEQMLQKMPKMSRKVPEIYY
jgi:hypothetical protein